MEPITATALIAALAAGVLGGVTEAGKQAMLDGYTKLKSALKHKFGEQSEVTQSVTMLEAHPQSEAKKASVTETLAEANADQDPNIHQLAQALLEQVKAQPGGAQTIQTTQTAQGSYQSQAAGGSSSSVNVNQPDQHED